MREKLALLVVAAAGSGLVALEVSGDGPPEVAAAGPAAPTPGPAPAAAESLVARPKAAARRAVPTRLAPSDRALLAALESMEVETAPEPPPEPVPEAPIDIDACLHDLRDDDVRWNASSALGELHRLVRAGTRLDELRLRAEGLLFSDDHQQRTLVTQLLIDLALREGARADPHPVVVERALDWLDGAPDLGFWTYRGRPSSGDAAHLCARRIDRVGPEVVARAYGRPGAARANAIAILAIERRTEHSALVARTLLPDLADNDVPGDALRAAWLLKRMGPAVAPHLRGPYVDDQQAELAGMLLAELERPGSSRLREPREDLSNSAPFGPVYGWEPRGWLQDWARARGR